MEIGRLQQSWRCSLDKWYWKNLEKEHKFKKTNFFFGIYNMEKSAWSFEEVQPFQNLVGPERLDIPIELSLDAWGLQPDMTVLENIANNKPIMAGIDFMSSLPLFH